MCNKAVDVDLSLKFACDCFVKKRRLKILITPFFSDDMVLVNSELKNVSLHNNNFDDADPKTIIHVRLVA